MAYTLTLDHSAKLVRYRHEGVIQRTELDAAWTDLMAMEEFTQRQYNLLSDYRNSTFDIPLRYAYDIAAFMSGVRPILDGKRQAIIVDNAFSSAASTLLAGLARINAGFIIKVFSTPDAAERWLASGAHR